MYTYLGTILHLPINQDTISDIMYICMGILLLLLLYLVYQTGKCSPVDF